MAEPNTTAQSAAAVAINSDAPAALIDRITEELAAGELKLPPLPDVATEVLASAGDEHVDASKLAGLIQKDQVLASHVLKVVNSPAFRGAVEVVALQQAISRLGMERVREIALTVSVKQSLAGDHPYSDLVAGAWKEGLATALWAREVARATRRNVEVAYLAGLLHNIGVPLLANRLGAESPQLEHAVALHVVGRLVQPAGSSLVQAWNLPVVISAVITHLESFHDAEKDADTVAVVAVGREFARRQLEDALVSDELQQLPAVQHLNLYPEDVEALLAHDEVIRLTLESMGS